MGLSGTGTNGANAHADITPWAIALAGLFCLATAMGIGRFAFTPLLPMMLSDGVIDLLGASVLASANYLGYLVGALLCTFQPWLWRRFTWLPPVAASTWVRAGLAATSLLTLGMALQLPALWPVLRFAAGVASAFVFIYTSGWCMSQLAARQASRLGGVMYAGPGAGIAFSGLLASGMVSLHWTAAAGWLILGVLACVLTTVVWPTFNRTAAPLSMSSAVSAASGAAAHADSGDNKQMLLLALAYGLAGFGYIITATFLPVIARQALPGSRWLDMFWPLFGLAVMAGALLTTRLSLKGDLRHLLAACYFVQALGVAVTVWSPTLAGFVAGSLLLGIPFTAITFFAMQEVRRLRPLATSSYMGLLTAVYGLGQIAGPPLVAVLLRHSKSVGEGFTLSLEIAAATLVVGALMYLWLARAYPMAVHSGAES
jgi:MFS family permease